MVVSPNAGAAGKGQPVRTARKVSSELKQDSFGDVLGKAGEESTEKTAKSTAETQGSGQENVNGKDAELDNVSKGREAASTDAQPGKEAQVKKDDKDGIDDRQKMNPTDGNGEINQQDQGASLLAAPAVMLDFSLEGQNTLIMEEVPLQTEKESTLNLQSLLPQSTEIDQKNKNFLAMLSGQQIKTSERDVADENMPQDLSKAQLQGQRIDSKLIMRPATMLEAQLNNQQLVEQGQEQSEIPVLTVLNNGRDTSVAKGMAPFEQNAMTMPSMSVGKVNDSVTLTNAGRVILPEGTAAQVQLSKEENAQPVKNLFGDVTITMEEVPIAAPAMDMRQNPRQGDFSQQNQQPSMPIMEMVLGEEGETVNQLAEEAVGDKASIKVQQSVNTESISMFQQSLNESLTGAKGMNDVNQPQQVQDDFNVPRQIVEQARLLRRGEDTQMVIKLHPDHLGELTLKVSVSANGAVNASFHSDNAQVRAIIENTLVQLKQELNNQGLKVDNVDVYAGLTDGQLPQGEGQQAWQQNQSSGRSIRDIGNVEDYGEDTDTIVNAQDSATDIAEGVDYRV